MVPAAGGSNKTRGAKEWGQTTPLLHLSKPDHGLRLLDSQLQTEITIETNVAANVNVTLVNGKTASEVENLPVVSAATENDLWDITTDANAKIVIRMTATAESVSIETCSSLSISVSIPLSFPTLSFLLFLLVFSSFPPLEYQSHRTLNAPLPPFTGRHPHSTPKEKKGGKKKRVFIPTTLRPHTHVFSHETRKTHSRHLRDPIF